jgi:hypothetical protein
LWGGSEGEQVIVISGTRFEGRDVSDPLMLEVEETEDVIPGKDIISSDTVERGGAAAGVLDLRRDSASGESDKSRGEVGMSSSRMSGFSKCPIIDSRF